MRLSPSHDEGNFQPSVPDGIRIYAIGDVHGRDDLLAVLLDTIEADRAARRNAKTILVFLGDLIDRGPSSAQVVERLLDRRRADARTVFVMGNHEEVLRNILDGDDSVIADWLRFGGDRCMESYGVEAAGLSAMSASDAGRVIRCAIPPSHRQFLESQADSFQAGDYLFVHAGIRPGIPLDQQSRQDLRWIRAPFLDHEGRHEFVVVHGHTISDSVVDTPARIGLDTGAYSSNVLTAMGFEGTARWVLQARQG